MAPEQHPGQCESCGAAFQWYPIHNGFNNSFYVYCPDCGTTAILDSWGTPLTHHPAIAKLVAGEIPNEIEGLLQPCSCGSRFRAGARPRCPHCGHELLPRLAQSAKLQISHNEAVGTGLSPGIQPKFIASSSMTEWFTTRSGIRIRNDH